MMIDRATFVGLRGWKDLEGDPECADTDYYDGYANTDYYLMTRGDGVVVASMRLTPVVDISTCLSVNFFSCDAQRDRASATINRLLEDKTILDLTRLIPNVDMFANVSSQPAVKSGFIGILGTAVASAVKHNTFHPTRPIVWVFTVDGLVRNFLEQEMMIPNLSEVLTHTQSTESTLLDQMHLMHVDPVVGTAGIVEDGKSPHASMLSAYSGIGYKSVDLRKAPPVAALD